MRMKDKIKKLKKADTLLQNYFDGYSDEAQARLLAATLVEECKDERVQDMKRNKDTSIQDWANAPPTQKQQDYIENLGGNPSQPKTKKQASQYIDKLQTQKNKPK